MPILLVTATGALILNRSLGLVKTSGDLAALIASNVDEPAAESGGEVTIGDQPIASSSLDATFTRTEDGMLTTTWTGPISGITLPVFVIAPRDYSPTDGKTYAVIELLHGYPARPTAPRRVPTSRRPSTTPSTPGSSRPPSSSSRP